MKMRWSRFAVPVLCVLFLGGCSKDSHVVERISIDFPHGETRLVVWKSGEAALYYGALMQHEVVSSGVFDVDNLYEQLQPRLHRNAPREEWPDPDATAGMVQVVFKDTGEEVYLIFNEEAFAEELFRKARINIVAERPW